MEGLLIAQVLHELGSGPLERGNWRFPDHSTFVLPVGDRNLWLTLRPPAPQLELRSGRAPHGGQPTPFQLLLQARAGGPLSSVSQLKLDRVVRLEFAEQSGFVTAPPVSLIVELTGRNANLILLDTAGTILGVQREVSSSENRYRQLRAGLSYVPPPAYERADPRELGAEASARLLLGRPLSRLRQTLDGFGPQLTAALSRRSGLAENEEVSDRQLPLLTEALTELLADPAAFLAAHSDAGSEPAAQRESAERSRLLRQVRSEGQRRLKLLRRRLSDVDRLEQAAARAPELREQADLLLAYRPAARPGAEVVLPGFGGEDVPIRLEPAQDAVATAETFYDRARRLEKRLSSARELVPALRQELAELERSMEQAESLPLDELRQLLPAAGSSRSGQHRRQPGIRVEGPHGFTILIGRNARDNDAITFGIARSRDIWLHVQGYRGSHVIIRADNREVPFETVLYAARLAAGHSQAADSDNVPVDYTMRKNVWRPKGAARGAVQFTAQKTVYVTPLVNATRDATAGG